MSTALDRLTGYCAERGLLNGAGPLCFIDRTAVVGPGTIVWHFARVLADAVIGLDCNVGGGAEIGRGTKIGDRSRISAGVFLPSNSKIGNDVFIGPNATFTDDRYPKTLRAGETYKAEPPVIEDGASIGAGAVILPGIRIGKNARVAAGAVVTKDVPDGLAVKGFAAKRFELSEEARTAYLSDFAETLSLGGQ